MTLMETQTFVAKQGHSGQASPIIQSTCLREFSAFLGPSYEAIPPLVKTPSMVDLPLSTFPTTAHRTSGVNETFGGGNRRRTDARGCWLSRPSYMMQSYEEATQHRDRE